MFSNNLLSPIMVNICVLMISVHIGHIHMFVILSWQIPRECGTSVATRSSNNWKKIAALIETGQGQARDIRACSFKSQVCETGEQLPLKYKVNYYYVTRSSDVSVSARPNWNKKYCKETVRKPAGEEKNVLKT